MLTDAQLFKLIRVLRGVFSAEHVAIALKLIPIAPRLRLDERTALTMGAYYKGLIVGLSIATSDETFPDCPYDRAAARSNFMRGRNDPRKAWRDGSLDGQRVRLLINWPDKAATLKPSILWREMKVLKSDPDLFAAVENVLTLSAV